MGDLQRGDKVKFLNDTGSGTVTRIIDREMVMVRTDDGFEYPVLKTELLRSVIAAEEISDLPVSSTRSESESVSNSEETPAEDDKMIIPDLKSFSEETVDTVLSVLFALEPQHLSEPVTGEADVFLINDCSFHILFHIGISSHNKLSTISHGYLEPDTKYLIGNYHIDDLFGGQKKLKISIISYKAGRYPDADPVVYFLKPESEFLTSELTYSENDYTGKRAMLVSLTDQDDSDREIDADRIREAMMSPGEENLDKPDRTRESTSRKGDVEEVDLHIENIVDDYSGMGSGEIIEIQTGRFRTALEGAKLNRQKRIIFIHGTGAGKLKHEIRRMIDQEYKSCRYQDASFREYGYGATMVIIK